MDLEGGRSASMKRKLAALEAPNPEAGMEHQEPALPAEDEEQGGAGDHISQPPDAVLSSAPQLPGADEGAAKDRISELPDGVLGDIISLLPTKEGARTQILASRWRHLWRSAPLNLDHHRLCHPDDRDATVTRVLSDHPGPGRRFCAPVYHLHGDRAATADAWLRSPALDNLQELELCSYGERFPYPPTMPLPPPAAAFRFSETLRVAVFGDCHIRDTTAQALHFPKLKQLGLKRVFISECSLHSMIASCPVLECLLIQHSFHEGIGSTIIQGLRVDNLTTSVCTVKILAVHMCTLSLNVIINLMRCFPCLEKLHIESSGPGEINRWRRKHRDDIKSLDIRLKTISWRYYRGIRSHVDFATFFVLNAKVLELMTLEVHKGDCSEEFISQQRKKLQLDSKASGGAQFRFTPNWSHHCAWYFHVHDLDLADPFEKKASEVFL